MALNKNMPRKFIRSGKLGHNLYIMRGLPGSKKSDAALQIGGVIYSTDDFFMHHGVYQFDHSKLKDAHFWNQKRTWIALMKGAPSVIVDNTNIRAKQIKPYVEIGIEHMYNITLVEPNTRHRWDVDKLFEKVNRTIPKKVILRMKDSYEHDLTLEKILAA